MFDFISLDLLTIVLFFISFFGLITARSAIKTIIFVLLMQTAVIMFWLLMGAGGGRPPIIYDPALLANLPDIADPVPQALMLTAIIIGISVTAVKITMLNYLFRKYGTADWILMAERAKEEERGKLS